MCDTRDVLISSHQVWILALVLMWSLFDVSSLSLGLGKRRPALACGFGGARSASAVLAPSFRMRSRHVSVLAIQIQLQLQLQDSPSQYILTTNKKKDDAVFRRPFQRRFARLRRILRTALKAACSLKSRGVFLIRCMLGRSAENHEHIVLGGDKAWPARRVRNAMEGCEPYQLNAPKHVVGIHP